MRPDDYHLHYPPDEERNMNDKDDRRVTLRRTLEQVLHCVEEALSVVEHGEDARLARDDVEQASTLLRGKVRFELSALVARQSLG